MFSKDDKSQLFSLPLNQFWVILLQLTLVLCNVEAQTFGQDFPPTSHTTPAQPSLAVVLGILCCIMSAVTFSLLTYMKFCRGRGSGQGNLQNQGGLIGRSSRFSGIDKTVIESLPFFRFSALKGSKEGLECAVCLSKFEYIEVLRLLPKCKHAFHLDCIDYWLEKHSSCPLCRQKVSSEDLKIIANSNSLRFLWNDQSELRDDSNIEVFVQREEGHGGSSGFSIGRSFRKIEKGDKDENLLIQEEADESNEDQKVFHKHNHKIIVSNFFFKHRWSSASSSDLMSLKSEMLNHTSSSRFSSMDSIHKQFPTTTGELEKEETMKITEEMEVRRTKKASDSVLIPVASSSQTSISMIDHQVEKRSMSEITALSRHGNLGLKNSLVNTCSSENNAKEERTRQLWLPIARRTVQWFASREKWCQQPQNIHRPLDV
ncbi:hypothetical protein FNV43_RR15805 [Rhamnella rubrinervis]|uniref:RING-type E3 ubiquitin transferase n=1 Tax=Rhamnella rubrinervis TaxID=2594499 RepID=A0A8K0E2F3_9ROSA|nr:hypothetical protein FNV43_RR15805 [Rhamnella rubrinervis]